MKKNIIIISIAIIALIAVIYMISATKPSPKLPGTAIPTNNLVQDGGAGEI